MILGIDASNIRYGGGITHLVELLRAAEPEAAGFSRVLLWAGSATLRQVDERPWLVKCPLPVLERRAFLPRALWQRFELTRLARSAGCDALFVPGGAYAGSYHPVITMSRNMLPFEWRELARFGLSWMSLKLLLLRVTQSRTLRRADAVIFLTRYAERAVTRVTGTLRGAVSLIPHGIDERFLAAPRPQIPIERCSAGSPLRLLYVSIVDMYKHQWNVAEAVARLRAAGRPIELTLVGPAHRRPLRRLRRVLRRVDPRGDFIHYAGAVPHAELHAHYSRADVCVFASSCENMPNILLEGMASGLPIACSRLGPMPEVLGDGGVYFDPQSAEDIARALDELIVSAGLRAALAARAFDRARGYSWTRCARETLEFLRAAARTV